MPVQEVSVGGRDERTEVTHFCASGLILECLTSGRLLFSLSSGHLGHAALARHVTATLLPGHLGHAALARHVTATLLPGH